MHEAKGVRRYRLSFTSGSLFLSSAGTAARLYLDLGSWPKVREALDNGNLMQARTSSSARRLGRELVQRLAELTNVEIALVANATSDERAHLMWAATCRRYLLLAEFASEIVRERYVVFARTLEPADFDAFVRGKALWHDELRRLAPSTTRKLQTSTFLMLREAQLLTIDGALVTAVISDRVLDQLTKRDPSDLRFFPMIGT